MGYEFNDPGLVEAMRRLSQSGTAEELNLCCAFLERYVNACADDDAVIAGAATVLAYTTKIPTLRAKFRATLIDNKVYLHRNECGTIVKAVCNAVAEVINPIDPNSLLMDQIAANIGKAMQDALKEIDTGTGNGDTSG